MGVYDDVATLGGGSSSGFTLGSWSDNPTLGSCTSTAFRSAVIICLIFSFVGSLFLFCFLSSVILSAKFVASWVRSVNVGSTGASLNVGKSRYEPDTLYLFVSGT